MEIDGSGPANELKEIPLARPKEVVVRASPGTMIGDLLQNLFKVRTEQALQQLPFNAFETAGDDRERRGLDVVHGGLLDQRRMAQRSDFKQ